MGVDEEAKGGGDYANSEFQDDNSNSVEEVDEETKAGGEYDEEAEFPEFSEGSDAEASMADYTPSPSPCKKKDSRASREPSILENSAVVSDKEVEVQDKPTKSTLALKGEA